MKQTETLASPNRGCHSNEQYFWDTDENKFLLFSGSRYYPSGGWNDFKGAFRGCGEALDYLADNIELDEKEWFHIVNLNLKEVVLERKYNEQV